MPSMIDASCPKCGKRFGWTGSMVNKPACPKCGYRDSQEDLAAADAAMKTFEELLASRPNASKCREQRIASGLSLRKAAERLGLSGQQLSDLEWGRQPIDAVMEQKMVELYQLGGER